MIILILWKATWRELQTKLIASRTTYQDFTYLIPENELDFGGLPSVIEYSNGVTKSFSYPNTNGSSFNDLLVGFRNLRMDPSII